MKLDLANDISRPALDTLKHNLKHTHPETEKSKVVLGDIIELYEFLGLEKVKKEVIGHAVVKTNKEEELKRKTDSLKENQEVQNLLHNIKYVSKDKFEKVNSIRFSEWRASMSRFFDDRKIKKDDS